MTQKDAPHYWVEEVSNAPAPHPRSCLRRFVLGEGPGPDSGTKMADEKANGELTEDELKADEYKLEANKFFKGRFSII